MTLFLVFISCDYSPSPVTHSGLTTSNWLKSSARNTRRLGLRSWCEWKRSLRVRWRTRSGRRRGPPGGGGGAQNSINSCRLCRESPTPTELCNAMSANRTKTICISWETLLVADPRQIYVDWRINWRENVPLNRHKLVRSAWILADIVH